MVYTILTFHHTGQQISIEPSPSLRNAARYGPTVFPIASAAVVDGFLLAFAAWRLEHGVSMLELEYIVSSRTVFSAITTPSSLRSINPLGPLLFTLWALSPLGGQAALRIVEVVPASHTSPWEFQYLNVLSPMLVCSPTSSAGMDAMPLIVGAFNSALASPGSIKNASMDAFGNLKIPMFESCLSYGVQPDADAWIDTAPSSNCSYSSLIGIPVPALSMQTTLSECTLRMCTLNFLSVILVIGYGPCGRTILVSAAMDCLLV